MRRLAQKSGGRHLADGAKKELKLPLHNLGPRVVLLGKLLEKLVIDGKEAEVEFVF